MPTTPLSFVLGLCLLAAPALGQALSSSGPDVIVGDLDDMLRYTDAAAEEQAFAIGTISCNVGDDVLNWYHFTQHHPVIATSMHRLIAVPGIAGATRFEQIGQAWLKHGFIAISGSFCNTCPPGSPSGSVLGVGCADPYGAALNGQQATLGPRSEVNPSTGEFPYPISWAAFPDTSGDGIGDQPAWSGELARRVRVSRADLLAAPVDGLGGLYFIEGQYVSSDDAAAGNKHNNASYRRILVDPATLDVQLTDLTQRTRPAIYAWRDHGLGQNTPDPSVTITPIDVPGDGRFLIASRVVQTGPSTWHYEYAVQNLNSHRALYALGITGGPSTFISNAGFRDINPHSGEIYDTNDWLRPPSGPTSTGVFRWSTILTPAANPRGNALRWGSIYNFWFDSNQPPLPGQAVLSMFNDWTAAPADFHVAIPAPAGTTTLLPFNDPCSGAFTIGRNEFAFSNYGAGNSAGTGECASSNGSTAFIRDVWFRYVHDGPPGTMTVSTCGSSFDTKLAVYGGAACPSTSGAALACNDDAPAAAPGGCGVGSTASLVQVTVATGQTYLIRVGGSPAAAVSSQSGNGILTLTPPALPTGACCRVDGSCSITRPSACNADYSGDNTTCAPNNCPQPPPPANDTCATAEWIADGAPLTRTNRNANTDTIVNACANGGIHDVWFVYRPAVSGDVDITTDNAVAVGGVAGGATDFDTNLALFQVCGGSLIDCDDDGGSSPEFSSHIYSAPLVAGQTYAIRVSGYPSTNGQFRTGVFTLKVIGGGGTVPASGACCTGTQCAVTAQSACTGVFQGPSSACGPTGNPTTCCPANFNTVGGVTVQDVFDFLIAYFSGAPSANINGVDGVTVQDIFDFLIAYFTGC